ncbi:energy transducer TonB [Pseudomonas tritici]|uniref:energy transducer TonB n=1 Tax=Pseudomonas tritici TaxID=2745518 RepID=UPI00387B5F5A
MKEIKLVYSAMVLSVCAIAVSAGTAGLGVLGNSSKLDKLESQLGTLREQNQQLETKATHQALNRARIDELDIGLTALASVANVDRERLAKAIAVARGQYEPPEPIVEPVADPESSESVAQVKVVPERDVQGAAVSTHAPFAAIPATKTPEAHQTHAEKSQADNPFAAAMAEPSDGEAATATLSISSVPAKEIKKSTIKEVDAILGKRISENWYKPAGATGNLTAIIQLKMGRDGKVASVKLNKASGNAAFDSSAVQAVQSILEIAEVRGLSEADFNKAYANRNIQFTPQMGG